MKSAGPVAALLRSAGRIVLGDSLAGQTPGVGDPRIEDRHVNSAAVGGISLSGFLPDLGEAESQLQAHMPRLWHLEIVPKAFAHRKRNFRLRNVQSAQ